MARFKAVLVIKDRNPRPEWVVEQLEAAGVDFSEHICWNADELAQDAGDADVVWSYGGRHGLLEGENLKLVASNGKTFTASVRWFKYDASCNLRYVGFRLLEYLLFLFHLLTLIVS